jgi:tRNA-Thr(GGU) m(6)t(6)A37 methyltransferase TsaA
MHSFTYTPIGYFSCSQHYPQQAPRQGTVNEGGAQGVVKLLEGCNYEQALEDLAGFSHIWLIYAFDRNAGWKPKVLPPRGSCKRGLFATRAPYRPNPIGISCVRLCAIAGRTLTVEGFDLLDKTPILDIKPYLPYADSFAQATSGWLSGQEQEFTLHIPQPCQEQLTWIERHASYDLASFLTSQLTQEPSNATRKRIQQSTNGLFTIAARTWRVHYGICTQRSTVTIAAIDSGYTPQELGEEAPDPYGDKAVHRAFRQHFALS